MRCRPVVRLPLILGLALAPLIGGLAHADPNGVAVVIGNRHYQGAVPEVTYAHRDAEAFKRYVLDALGYDPANVIDLRDATQAEMAATFGNENGAEGSNLWSYLNPAGSSDVVVFYSGHGVPSQRDGKGYLLPADADPNVPHLNAYPIDRLYANLAELTEAGSVAVFLDACFSGGSQRGTLIKNASPVYVSAALPTTVGSAMTVLTAASSGQLASWDTAASHGMFTHHLLDALYGKGDADGDGRVTATEAKRYLDRHMTRATRRAYKRNQVASLLGDGEMALAFSGGAGFRPRPTLGPGGVSAAEIDEMDGARWAKQRTNLRRGPSTEHPVAGSLAAGEEVAVKGKVRDADWLLVATQSGAEAFVYAPLLDDRPPSAQAAPSTQAPAPSTPAASRDTAQETVFWESVKDGDASGFEAYLQQYPEGAFVPLAVTRLQRLVWTPIEDSREPRTFERFLAANPDSHFAEHARAALQHRIEQADRRTAERYLNDYPQSAFATLARERLSAIEWEQVRDNAQPHMFEEFLAAFPESQLAEQARATLRQRIKEADKRTVAGYLADYPQGAVAALAIERLPAAEYEEMRENDQPKVFEEFLAAYPDSEFAEPVRAALQQRIERANRSELDAYLARYPHGTAANLARERMPAAVWANIRDNTQPRVFEEYLTAYSSSRFAEPARAALRRLIGAADKSKLDRYLARYPRGAAADLARERLPTAEWARIRYERDFRVFWNYLQEYPRSAHVNQARERLRATISQELDVGALEKFMREEPDSGFADEARKRMATLVWRTVADSIRTSDLDGFLAAYPHSREASLARDAKAKLPQRLAPFVEEDGIWVGRDCRRCPEMVVVPAGSYRMGSASGESNERPVHEVTIEHPFAVGKYEVTFAQWGACARARACPRGEDIADDEGWGRRQRPVINVNWSDAQRYVRWLSGETKKSYRLLSESEWEYAARAGTRTAYSWGGGIGNGRANCKGCGSRWDDQTAPVGSFAANAWGLHDMHGNVWEWVADCRNRSYAGAPRDGSAWLVGDCSRRVLRGGSWGTRPWNLRSTFRLANVAGSRNLSIGFRVARTLAP